MASEDTDFALSSPVLSGGFAAVKDHLRGRFLDHLGEPVVATDPEGRIVYWNEAATELMGWEAEEVEGARILDLAPSGGFRDRARRILARLERGRSWSGEFLVQDRSGREIRVLATGTPVRDADGKLAAIVGIFRDISGQREAENALRASEERVDLIRRAAQSVIWELDPVTGTVDWSDGMGDVFGYAAEDIGPTLDWWRDRIHPDDRARLEHSFTEFLEDDRRFWTEEYRFLRSDGTYADVFDRAYAAEKECGGKARVAGAMVDLTERRRLQDERRLLAQAGMILDLSLDFEATLPTVARLITNVLADFCIIHLTPGAHVPPFTASSHADPIHQTVLDDIAEQIGPLPPRGSIIDRVFRDREPILLRNVPHELREHGGTPAAVRDLVLQLDPSSILIVPIQARADRLGFMILGSTAFRSPFGEPELRLAEELSRRIGTAVDHARMYEAEQLANRVKADFLAVMSHELRTPLTAVLGYADLLAGEVSGPLNDHQQRQVQRIRAGTDRLHRLMESILAYVRLETGQERPSFEWVEARDLMDRVREVVGPRAAEEGVEFRIEADSAPERIATDPDRFLQVVLSLLMNAIKFARQGTILLRVGVREDGDDHSLEVDVVDDGPGIPEQHQPYVFNAFWQVEQPSTRRAGGAGLGLSVARRLARLLGGDVVIAASSPAGTTFRFTHPTRDPG